MAKELTVPSPFEIRYSSVRHSENTLLITDRRYIASAFILPHDPMLLEDAWQLLQEKVFPTPSTDILFNPYRDAHADYDRPGAVATRRANLRRYLACYETLPPVFLLAEAPGPWGCRFSGVPLVSEAQLVDAAFPIDGAPTSLEETPHHEYSARIYWRVLGPYFPHFFTWNSVPYHPHHADRRLSIRTPKASEVAASTDVLAGLLAILKPRRILAIGRKAERALKTVDAEATYVRHPSQGGAKRFEAGVLAVMETVF